MRSVDSCGRVGICVRLICPWSSGASTGWELTVGTSMVGPVAGGEDNKVRIGMVDMGNCNSSLSDEMGSR